MEKPRIDPAAEIAFFRQIDNKCYSVTIGGVQKDIWFNGRAFENRGVGNITVNIGDVESLVSFNFTANDEEIKTAELSIGASMSAPLEQLIMDAVQAMFPDHSIDFPDFRNSSALTIDEYAARRFSVEG